MTTAAQANADQDKRRQQAADAAQSAGAGQGAEAKPFTEAEKAAEVAECLGQLQEIKGNREQLNKENAAIIEKLEAKFGWNRHAVRAAIGYTEMSEKKQDAYDKTYREVRAALGQPVQESLFESDSAVKH